MIVDECILYLGMFGFNGFYGGNDCNSSLVYVFIIFKDLYLVYVLIFNLVFFKVLYFN